MSQLIQSNDLGSIRGSGWKYDSNEDRSPQPAISRPRRKEENRYSTRRNRKKFMGKTRKSFKSSAHLNERLSNHDYTNSLRRNPAPDFTSFKVSRDQHDLRKNDSFDSFYGKSKKEDGWRSPWDATIIIRKQIGSYFNLSALESIINPGQTSPPLPQILPPNQTNELEEEEEEEELESEDEEEVLMDDLVNSMDDLKVDGIEDPRENDFESEDNYMNANTPPKILQNNWKKKEKMKTEVLSITDGSTSSISQNKNSIGWY